MHKHRVIRANPVTPCSLWKAGGYQTLGRGALGFVSAEATSSPPAFPVDSSCSQMLLPFSVSFNIRKNYMKIKMCYNVKMMFKVIEVKSLPFSMRT